MGEIHDKVSAFAQGCGSSNSDACGPEIDIGQSLDGLLNDIQCRRANRHISF
jgi:hypothetical protein